MGRRLLASRGGGDRVVLLVEFALEESQVVKNWSGEKMFLVGIKVDRFLDVSVFSIVCSRRRYLVHEIPRTLRYHHHRIQE